MRFGGRVEPRVFVVWMGPASTSAPPMSDDRAGCLESVRAAIGLEVCLISDDNLGDWEVPGHPIHPAYRWLSAVHKSDYLRAYLMHHHGGGYTDIKRTHASWESTVAVVNHSPDLFGAGFPEPAARTVAMMNADTTRPKFRRVVDPRYVAYRVLQHEYHRLIGTSAFLFRPHSTFTSHWLSRVNRRMDRYSVALETHPAQHPMDARPTTNHDAMSGYPIPWTDLLGNVFHPLCLRYSRHLARSLPAPEFTDYR